MEEKNTPTKTFIRVAVPENIYLQCGKLVDNPALRRKLFSGKQDKNVSESGASSRRCVSARQRLGKYSPKLLVTQRNADKEKFSS